MNSTSLALSEIMDRYPGQLLLNMRQVAEVVGIPEKSFRALVRHNNFPVSGRKVGGKMRAFDIRQIASLLDKSANYTQLSSLELLEMLHPGRLVFTVREVSRIINWSESSVRNAISGNVFPIQFRKMADKRIVDAAHLVEFLDQGVEEEGGLRAA